MESALLSLPGRIDAEVPRWEAFNILASLTPKTLVSSGSVDEARISSWFSSFDGADDVHNGNFVAIDVR